MTKKSLMTDEQIKFLEEVGQQHDESGRHSFRYARDVGDYSHDYN